MGFDEETLLKMEKTVDWNRRSNMVLVCIAGALALALVALMVPIHPFLLALMAAALGLASVYVVGRVRSMRRESITITRNGVSVVMERERRYAIDPSTKVHLDTGKRGLTERIGPIDEISFESRREGMSRLAVANGWTHEQVAEVYRVIHPMVEPKEMSTSMRFRRYMRDSF